jgi:hypothetical protein
MLRPDFKSKLLNRETMKNLKMITVTDVWNEFLLSNEEMIRIHGGDDDPVVIPQKPPIII